ncbi:hypothetical protein PoB_006838700 [Plakobranchus ocellatus]|uniref:Uncharacterized protein n=1 Tax=Plakobranchus ocellatus TaxID=259542 RepID=A0AAV4DC96_9GAST|nr:hypothetical protein PoB_006838700 [Plakobranchus ocellatus]
MSVPDKVPDDDDDDDDDDAVNVIKRQRRDLVDCLAMSLRRSKSGEEALTFPAGGITKLTTATMMYNDD